MRIFGRKQNKSTFFPFQGSSLAMYIYAYEMLPQKYRAYMGIFDGVWWAFNVMSISLFGYALHNYSWKYLHVATGLVCSINLLTYCYMYA